MLQREHSAIFLTSIKLPFVMKISALSILHRFYCTLLCVVTVCFLCLVLAVPLVGMQSVIVAFPRHTHVHFDILNKT